MKRLFIAFSVVLTISILTFAGDPKPKKPSTRSEPPADNKGCSYYIPCGAEIYHSGGETSTSCALPVRAPYIRCGLHGGMTCYN